VKGYLEKPLEVCKQTDPAVYINDQQMTALGLKEAAYMGSD
jgi:hypothetical protein